MSFPYNSTIAIDYIVSTPSAQTFLGLAIERVNRRSNEHATSSVMSIFLNHTFSIVNGWVITGEKILDTNKKPDFCVEG